MCGLPGAVEQSGTLDKHTEATHLLGARGAWTEGIAHDDPERKAGRGRLAAVKSDRSELGHIQLRGIVTVHVARARHPTLPTEVWATGQTADLVPLQRS